MLNTVQTDSYVKHYILVDSTDPDNILYWNGKKWTLSRQNAFRFPTKQSAENDPANTEYVEIAVVDL